MGKLWNSDHEVEIVPQAYQRSLDDLGVDYLDLHLIFVGSSKNDGDFPKLRVPFWGSSKNDGDFHEIKSTFLGVF